MYIQWIIKALLVQLSKCLVQFHFIILLLQFNFLVIRFVPTFQQTIQYSIVLICATICAQECFKLVPHDTILLLPTRNMNILTPGRFCLCCSRYQSHVVRTGSGAHPASYPMGTGGSFPGDKAAEA
jgi:hypothetical protein